MKPPKVGMIVVQRTMLVGRGSKTKYEPDGWAIDQGKDVTLMPDDEESAIFLYGESYKPVRVNVLVRVAADQSNLEDD